MKMKRKHSYCCMLMGGNINLEETKKTDLEETRNWCCLDEWSYGLHRKKKRYDGGNWGKNRRKKKNN
jgi:hypothetical protein